MNSIASRSVTILGSTGSIGRNTLDVIRRNRERFTLKAISANTSIEEIRNQIGEFHPESVVITDASAAAILQKEFGALIRTGAEALSEIATSSDIIVAAMVGFAGLRPTLEAIRAGKRVAIANKETLVVAGEIMTALAKVSGAEILPIDSEHSAISQCLVGESPESIKRIILTASGGPFRTREKESFKSITLAEALKHPNWVMGRKITIDSATLANKGLEIIEARWLFGVELEKVDVIVHPQSIIHSMVEFCDGSIKAQLGAPDMRLPIQYALGYPERLRQEYDKLDLLMSNKLEFELPDTDKFPCLKLARISGERGGVYPCIFNAANEIAVEAFLNEEIAFTDIPQIITQTLDEAPPRSGAPLDASSEESITLEIERIYHADQKAREFAKQLVTANVLP
ncbi:MAG: 1-deoxy-D-xylulose-5-phosphate reductoisomerase [Ignavibacteriota bacterium]